MSILLETIEAVLNRSGIILYPTDTVWGIGCDATNATAIEKLYALKKRKKEQPLIILVSSIDMLKEYVEDIPVFVLDFLNTLKKPTTIIYPKAKKLPDILLSSDKSIGIRLVQKYIIHDIILKFGKPIVSTSANFSGKPVPKNYKSIDSELITLVDFVVPEKYDISENVKPSDIYKIVDDKLIQIR